VSAGGGRGFGAPAGRRFAVPLMAIVVAGLVLRLVYVLALSRGLHDPGDSEFFHRIGLLIGDGRGFTEPLGLALTGDAHPTALHPPLYPLLLGAGSWLGIDSYLGQRVIGCLVGAAAIGAVGLLGRRVGGERVGLIAAALAAVYPVLIGADGAVMSESLFGLLVVLALLAAYRLAERPSAGRAAVAGAAVGLAALTRAEALALLVLALAPAAAMGTRRLRADAGWVRTAALPVAVALLACVLVLAPWTVRNWSAFDRPILISNNSGTLISGANCDRTYRGYLIGSWDIYCVEPGPASNEAVVAAHERRVGIDHALDHADRLPVVLGARLLRTFGLYQPVAEADLAEGRSYSVALAGTIAFWLLLPIGLYGAWVLRRRGAPLFLLAAPFGLAVIVSLVGYGLPRFRHPADLALVVLAAVALDEVLRRRGRL
jgi:4-amino-4-deoxy-L-arabinose transferase-like glycosyltransferase